jgi:hypothetical protein
LAQVLGQLGAFLTWFMDGMPTLPTSPPIESKAGSWVAPRLPTYV